MKKKKYNSRILYTLLGSLICIAPILGATSAFIALDNANLNNQTNSNIQTSSPTVYNQTNEVSSEEVDTNTNSDINFNANKNDDVVVHQEESDLLSTRKREVTGRTTVARGRIDFNDYNGSVRKFNSNSSAEDIATFLGSWQVAAWNNGSTPLIFNNCDNKLIEDKNGRNLIVTDFKLNPLTGFTFAYVKLKKTYNDNSQIIDKPLSVIVEIANSVEENPYDPFTPTLMTNNSLLKPYNGKFIWWNDVNDNQKSFNSLRADLYSMEYNQLTNKYVQLFTDKDHALAIGLTDDPYVRPTNVFEFTGFKNKQHDLDFSLCNNMKMIPVTDDFGITNEYLIFPAGPLGYNDARWANYVYLFRVDPNIPEGGILVPFSFEEDDPRDDRLPPINARNHVAVNAIGIRKINIALHTANLLEYYMMYVQVYDIKDNCFRIYPVYFKTSDDIWEGVTAQNCKDFEIKNQLWFKEDDKGSYWKIIPPVSLGNSQSTLTKLYKWNYENNTTGELKSLITYRDSKNKNVSYRYFLVTDALIPQMPLSFYESRNDPQIETHVGLTYIIPTYNEENFDVITNTVSMRIHIKYWQEVPDGKPNDPNDEDRDLLNSGLYMASQKNDNLFFPDQKNGALESNDNRFYPFNPIYSQTEQENKYVNIYLKNSKTNEDFIDPTDFKFSTLPWPMGVTFSSDQSRILVNVLKCNQKNGLPKTRVKNDCALTSGAILMKNFFNPNDKNWGGDGELSLDERAGFLFGGTANGSNNDALFPSSDNILYSTSSYANIDGTSKPQVYADSDNQYDPSLDIMRLQNSTDDPTKKEYSQYRARTFYFDINNDKVMTISPKRWNSSGKSETFSQKNVVSEFYVNNNGVRKIDLSKNYDAKYPNGYNTHFFNDDTSINPLLSKKTQYVNLISSYFADPSKNNEFMYFLYSLHGLLINWKTANMSQFFDNTNDFPYALNLMHNVLYDISYASNNSPYLVQDYYNGRWQDWPREETSPKEWRFPGMLDANNQPYPDKVYKDFIKKYKKFFYIDEDSVTWTKDGLLKYTVTYPNIVDEDLNIKNGNSMMIELKISSSWNSIDLTANQQYWESVNSSLDAVNRKIKEINQIKTSLEIYNANIFNTKGMIQMIVPGSFKLVDYNPSLKTGIFSCQYYFHFDNNDPTGIIAKGKDTALIEFMTGGESSGPVDMPSIPKEISVKGTEFANMNASAIVNEMNVNSPTWVKFKTYAAEQIVSEMKKQIPNFDISSSDISFSGVKEFNYSKGYIDFNVSISSYPQVSDYQSAFVRFKGFRRVEATSLLYIADISSVNIDVISKIKPSKLQSFLNEKWWHIFYFVDVTNGVGKTQVPWKPYVLGNDSSGNPTYVKNPSFNEAEVNGYDQNKINQIAQTNTTIKPVVNSFNDSNGTASVSLFVQNLYVDTNNVLLDPSTNEPTAYTTKRFDFTFTNLNSSLGNVTTTVPPTIDFNREQSLNPAFIPYRLSDEDLARKILQSLKNAPSNLAPSDVQFVSRLDNNRDGKIHIKFKLSAVLDDENKPNKELAKSHIFDTTITKLTTVTPTRVEFVNHNGEIPEALIANSGIVKWSEKWFNNDGSFKQSNPYDLMWKLINIFSIPTSSSSECKIRLVNINPILNTATINYGLPEYFIDDNYCSIADNFQMQIDIQVFKGHIVPTRIVIQGKTVNEQPVEIINYKVLREIEAAKNEIVNTTKNTQLSLTTTILLATLLPAAIILSLLIMWFILRKFKNKK